MDRHEDKAQILMEISFPPPTEYYGDEGREGPPGTAYQAIDSLMVDRAFRGTSSRKSPGPATSHQMHLRLGIPRNSRSRLDPYPPGSNAQTNGR